jgi:lactoylglutathione lyase
MTDTTDTTSFAMTAPLEVGIGCHDLALMRRFYEDTLGLRFVSEGRAPEQTARAYRLARGSATVVRLQTSNGERIKLVAPDDAPVPPAEHDEYVFDRPNVMYLTFIIADVNAAISRLRDAGISCMSGDQRVQSRPGLYVAFLRDPEGNVVELVQYDDIRAYRADLSLTKGE